MIELPILDADAAGAEPPKETFWRSPAQLKGDAALKRHTADEFMPGATDAPGGTSRRQFLQLMGASMALAGLTACRRPVEKILPYVRKPEDVVEGIPLFYATAMPFRGSLNALLVEAHEGRPTKVEGNPEHPLSRGATGLFDQASILNLYDPDRSGAVLREGSVAAWRDFVDYVGQLTLGAAGKRLWVMADEQDSPTRERLRGLLEQRFPLMRWMTFSVEGSDPTRLGLQQAFGRPLRPQYRFTEADVIVSLDADFLSPTARNFVGNTRSFAESRRLTGPDDTLNRLYVVESRHSLTGGQADNRLRLRSSEIPAFAAALAQRLGLRGTAAAAAAAPPSGDGAPADTLAVPTPTPAGAPATGAPATAADRFADHPWVVELASELRQAGSRSLVLAGETQPPAVHALCAAINSALGSTAVVYYDAGEPIAQPMEAELQEFVAAAAAGQVDALLLLNTNPVYAAPAALDFAAAMDRVADTIHFGLHLDETAQKARWHVPAAHYLESWSDGRAYDGTASIIQPLIAPLYDDAHSDVELLNLLATGLDQPGYDLVRETWRGQLGGDFEKAWRQTLHDGFIAGTAFSPVTPGSAAAPSLAAFPLPADDALEVVFDLDARVLDGSYANNAWQQELPDPITKLVWDNVAAMSVRTAERLGLEVEYDEGSYYADVIALTLGDHTLELPVWIVPGMADNTIALSFGYGRTIRSLRPEADYFFWNSDTYTDIYGDGALATGVGVNVAPARTVVMERVAVGAQVAKTGRTHKLVTTQEHGIMEGRPVFRQATLEEYRQHPGFARDAVKPLPGGEPWEDYPALWQEDHPQTQNAFKDNPYYVNQWGMVIDLNACTGCSACIVACNSENNIQVVGKDQVSRGREMHWMRLDRYYVSPTGEADEALDLAGMVVQPVLCMHCENAPCEPVCPVAATVHSPDGTNQMIYNRCIGTRYCSNNCPYKVRRYNWYNWTKTLPLQVHMAQNPNVTVRSRGVMEKCSYCIQRIREVNQRTNIENRPIQDGEVQTACQQVCPAQAITFGDLNDPNSRVMQLKRNPRSYEMLAELNVKPRTSYLGRVRNPNPRLARPQA